MLRQTTFTVVIETENLGMAGLEDLKASLKSLKKQTFPIDQANEVLVIASGHITPATLIDLKHQFPWLIIHSVKNALKYTEAKVKGAEEATGEIVIFADSDVHYDESWLESLLQVFKTHPDAGVVAGDTRLKMNSIYEWGLGLTWFLPVLAKIKQPKRTTHFRFNNFAIKKSTILENPFPANYPLYRGNARVWRERLLEKGIKFYRAPGAMGYHAAPEGIANWWYRMMILGSDSIAKADFSFSDKWETIEKKSPLKRLRNLAILVTSRIWFFIQRAAVLTFEDFRNVVPIFLSLPVALSSMSVIMLGGLVAVFNRDYIYRKITALEELHNV